MWPASGLYFNGISDGKDISKATRVPKGTGVGFVQGQCLTYSALGDLAPESDAEDVSVLLKALLLSFRSVVKTNKYFTVTCHSF